MRIEYIYLIFTLLFTCESKATNIDSLRNILKNGNLENKDKVNTLIAIAVAVNLDSLERSLYYTNTALDLAYKVNYNQGVGEALLFRSNLLYEREEYAKGLIDAKKALEVFGDEIKPKEYIVGHNQVSINYWALSQWDSAKYYGELCANKCREEKDSSSLSIITYNLGLVCQDQDSIEQALYYFSRATEISKSIQDSIGLQHIYSSIGLAFRDLGDYEGAVEYFFKSLEIYKTDSYQKAYTLRNIGSIYSRLKKFDLSREFCKKALVICDSFPIRTQSIRAIILSDLGLNAISQDSLDIAGDYLYESFRQKRDIGTPSSISSGHHNLGHFLSKKGRDEEAIIQFEKAYNIHNENKEHEKMSRDLINIGSCYTNIKDYVKAEINLLKGLKYAKKVESLELIVDGYNELQTLYCNKKEFEQAYEYQGLYLEYKDSLFKQEKTYSIIAANTKFETREKEVLNIQLEREKELVTEQLSLQKQINVLVIIGVLVLSSLIALLFFRTKQLKKQKNTTQILLKEVQHRVKNNLQLILSLLEGQSRQLKDEGIKTVFRDTESRIQAMALIHQKLLKEESNLTAVNIKEHIEMLVENLRFSFKNYRLINIDIQCDDVVLDVETALPLSLIINEITTNAMKHAFLDQPSPLINISLAMNNDELKLVIEDNGKGIPDEVDIFTGKSYGMQIVNDLTLQLKGAIDIVRKPSTRFEVTTKHFKLI